MLVAADGRALLCRGAARVNGEFKRFRMDYDPEKGSHINVEVGKGGSARKWAVPWKGTEGDFARILGGNS